MLGGAFDPVHHGHLRLALELLERLGLQRVHLVPTGSPVHRGAARAPAEARARMLAAAVVGCRDLVVDERELDRGGPSFMLDTLASLRSEAPGRALWLLLGMDAFGALDTWHRWEELLEYAHIGVGQRPGSAPPETGPVAELLRARRVDPGRREPGRTEGTIAVIAIPSIDVSSTGVRARLAGGRDPRYLVPSAVLRIIRDEGLYDDAQ